MNPEEPEEPHLHSEASLLSPASPKPIHFPAPTNIPVLNNMMDVNFNQTELHMQDPAMRNTEIRDGAWRSPAEEKDEKDATGGQTDPSGGAETAQSTAEETAQTAATETPLMPPLINDHTQEVMSPEAPPAGAETAAEAATTDVASIETSLHEHVPTGTNASMHGTALTGMQTDASTPVPSNSDVQSLLHFLQTAPKSAQPTSATPTAAADDQAANFLASLGAPPIVVPQTLDTQPAKPETAVYNDLGLPGRPPADLAAALASVTPSTNTAPLPRALSSQRERKIAAGEPVTEDDAPWTSDIQLKYDDFIVAERAHVNDGAWDSFPLGSRLFIGNLSSDSVTKRDIFHVFHSYGPLAQISIKQAYGFVQFLNAEDCGRALIAEQGRLVKDKRIHLEISKPQKPRNQQNNNRNRSRSPDRRRANHDRHQGSRDSHRYRSPSPRGHRDRFDERNRRSRTPPGYGRTRHGRSATPDDDLPLPMRPPHEVPDIQIIVRDNLDRDFIAWVEKAFLGRGLKAAVLILTPRLHEDAVIRRQIVEGVLGISRLDRQAQGLGKISLRVFDRSRGTQNVSFDDYDNLDPNICAELILRAKATQAAPPAQYGYPPAQPPAPQYGYGAPAAAPQYMPPPQAYAGQPQFPAQPPPGQPQLDMGSLQNLLATARGGNQMPTPQATPAGYPGYPPQQMAYPPSAPPQAGFPGYQQQPAYGARPPPLPQGVPPAGAPPSGGHKVDMQDILARLGNYQK